MLDHTTQQMKSNNQTISIDSLKASFGSIKSNGQCIYDANNTATQTEINNKLRTQQPFEYNSKTVFDRQQCGGTVLE